jgi:hypothetical protein
MTSSFIPAARSQYLLDLLAQVPDPRKRRGRRHPLAGAFAFGIAAVIAGRGRSPRSGSGPQMPGRTCWPGWPGWARPAAIDGKAVRGAKGKDGKAPHLIEALAHGICAVLGQAAAVDAKSDEIPAVRDLLKALADLAGAMITTGALHTQHDTAKAILARQADYVMTVKGNMPTPLRPKETRRPRHPPRQTAHHQARQPGKPAARTPERHKLKRHWRILDGRTRL